MYVQATPANWPNNHESIGAKGWAFLLPTVTPEDADKVRALFLKTWEAQRNTCWRISLTHHSRGLPNDNSECMLSTRHVDILRKLI